MTDRRSLFSHMTARKASSWDELQIQNVDDQRMMALNALPMRLISWDTTPMHEFLGAKQANDSGTPLEWVLQRVGGDEVQYFYVNTEGYQYARYAFRFEPRTVKR